MEPNRRFTTMTFPQFFDGTVLKVNIVFLPRNQNPLIAAIEGDPNIPDAQAFADAKLSFVAKIITGLSGLPDNTSSVTTVPLTTVQPANVRPLFEALSNQFQINNSPDQAPDPVPQEQSVKKYLPYSYRQSFNFVAPKTKNAVTDESYHCAVRAARPIKRFQQSPDKISWGKVFAHAMRQPLLAQSLGMIYETELTIDASYFPKGGWLYIDLADDSDYMTQQKKDVTFTFIKKYAARIPSLKPGDKRNLFAAVQFPVLPQPPPGNYDDIFIEAADYDDGFAKIVHAFQPVSNNLLLEESDGFHPTKEVGIRLGWDDEQILIWYMRQLMKDENTQQRIDAPVGVFGYRIDVREKTTPPGEWQSLNAVSSKESLKVVDPATMTTITVGDFKNKELNYQVYPSQLDGDSSKNYWLPMYFANWNGKSMVLPDDDAAAIYQNDQDIKPDGPTNVKGAPSNNLNKIYEPAPINTSLQYGKIYQFRVRLGDLSGGGPDSNEDPVYETSSQVATVHFKRFVAPGTVRIDGLPANADEKYFGDTKLTIKRPLLGYPSTVFTGKYSNAVDLLKKAAGDQVEIAKQNRTYIDSGEYDKVQQLEAFGIADPDVDAIEITVELKTLKMDNLMSISGKEPYIKFYTTTRKFPKASTIFDDELIIPLEYKDCRVLNFGDPGDLGDLGVNQSYIDSIDNLILPTARIIRLSIRPVCEKKDNYYGLEKPEPEFNTRYGRTIQFLLYKESADERDLFANTNIAKKIEGIWLQPDPTFVYDGNPTSILFGKEVEKPPDMVQRIAQQLELENNGLTLVGKKGERVQFGCSNRIRHTLSPDNSSITFASKGDLMNHWLCCITLQIERDWAWDALQDLSFTVQRKKRFKEDDIATEIETIEAGDIEIKKTAPFNALLNPERGRTTIIFIDAVEPKNDRMQPVPNDKELRFPDLIELEYTVQAKFKYKHAAQKDGDLVLPLELPITVSPAQVPKIVSAGIALSPYVHNQKYSTTEPRRRFLWIEFDEPVNDPKDTYFARVLASAPDQLISNNNPELLIVSDEPALPIDPEYVRVITPDQSNDDAGLDAMQPMEKATDSDTHYLLPLPSGLHSESPEMFGFFTYEFRVGHYRYSDTSANHKVGESVWTTAQGRFGRVLKASGIQHPAPTLTFTVNRDEEKLYVTAPYAVAVHNGKNVTSDPPRTEIWALLYTQVKQADNRDFRNILLDDKILDWNVRVEHDKKVDWNVIYTDEQRAILKRATIRNWKDEIDYGKFRHVYKLVNTTTVNKDATKYGTVIWSNTEINQLLTLYGLPLDSSLSVLCVEIMPQITNLYDHVNDLNDGEVQNDFKRTLTSENFPLDSRIKEELAAKKIAMQSINLNEAKPLSDKLGNYRILRTSPLTEVPFVCCEECKQQS